MPGELRVWNFIESIVGGVTRTIGSLRDPIKPVAITGVPIVDDTVVVPANSEAVLWVWAASRDFTFAQFTIDGFGELRWRVDRATSSTNKTPAGTATNWLRKQMSCYAVETFQVNTAKAATTVADQVSSAAGGASMGDGFIYEFRFFNPSTSTPVSVRRVMIQ